MKDTFNELFKGSSLNQRGTLVQLKNYFRHKSVSSKVMQCFNHAEDFLRFVTEAHITYYCLMLLGIDDTASIPPWHDQQTDKAVVLNQVSRRMVNEVWCFPSLTELQEISELPETANDAKTDQWCICGE